MLLTSHFHSPERLQKSHHSIPSFRQSELLYTQSASIQPRLREVLTSKTQSWSTAKRHILPTGLQIFPSLRAKFIRICTPETSVSMQRICIVHYDQPFAYVCWLQAIGSTASWKDSVSFCATLVQGDRGVDSECFNFKYQLIYSSES